MEKRIEDAEDRIPSPPPRALSASLTIIRRFSTINVLARGDYQNKGVQVGPRPLGILVDEGTPELATDAKNPRTQLAPLGCEPRQSAHRSCDRQSGVAIPTSAMGWSLHNNDFGRMGARPTHPELLDWLANEFVASGWKFKQLHREILYEQHLPPVERIADRGRGEREGSG